ncbi:MAG: hypothetical protein IPK60_13565 [Sandaracinaceae bacterium]|nr:hypothetical protein [Sandaracinaceae bacterium]
MSRTMRIVGVVCAAAVIVPTTFHADAQETVIPTYWDDGATSIYVANQRISGSDPERYAWSPTLLGRIGGRHQRGDVLIISVKEGRRELASKRCVPDFRETSDPTMPASFQCRMDDVQIDHAGNFLFDLSYEDQNGNATPLRTLQVPILAYSYMIDRSSRRHTAMYLVAPDDMLGSSIAFLDGRPARWNTAYASENGEEVVMEYRQSRLVFRFWSTRPNLSLVNDTQVRCTVDGAPLTVERAGSAQLRPQTNYYGDDRRSDGQNVAENRYAYNLWEVSTGLFVVEKGARSAAPPVRPGQVRGGQHVPTPPADVTAHPGNWSCTVRAEGHELRRFDFVVTANGLAPHAIQSGDNALHLGADEFFVDTTILPGASDFDRGYDRNAVRASGFWGRTWTTQPPMLTSLAASFGDPHPAAVGGGRSGGRARH